MDQCTYLAEYAHRLTSDDTGMPVPEIAARLCEEQEWLWLNMPSDALGQQFTRNAVKGSAWCTAVLLAYFYAIGTDDGYTKDGAT